MKPGRILILGSEGHETGRKMGIFPEANRRERVAVVCWAAAGGRGSVCFPTAARTRCKAGRGDVEMCQSGRES